MTHDGTAKGGNGWERWRLPAALAVIALVTLAVYSPALHNPFIDYDDTDYVTLNMAVREGLTLKGVAWAFTAFHAANWHPLTWLSHMLDIELFGLNAAGHHGVSIVLHAVNAMLLCHLLHRITGYLGRSAIVATLFALHPLHVESVAWIAERKDVLSTLFWLLTMEAYVWYARERSLRRYLVVALLFALGLMAKQMLVTLPLILLLVDYWPLKRFAAGGDGEGAAGVKRLVAEKIPLLALAGAAALVTIRSQSAVGALSRGEGHSTLLFAGNALISYVKYIGKMFWPSDLALFYPFTPAAVTPLRAAGAVALLAAITVFAVLQRKSRPFLLFGWLWYLVTLLPVIGFVRVGSQAMADRYTYIPLTGLFIVIVWGAGEAAARWRAGLRIAAGVAVLVPAILSALTVAQIRYWRSSFDLYAHALEAVPDNWLAHNNIAVLLAQQYRNDESVKHFRESLRIFPEQEAGWRNLGNVLQASGNNAAAIDAFREAARINPDDGETHYRLGYAYLLSGNVDGAYAEYQQLTRLDQAAARSLLDSIRMATGKR